MSVANDEEACRRFIIVFGPPCPCEEGVHAGMSRVDAFQGEIRDVAHQWGQEESGDFIQALAERLESIIPIQERKPE